MPPSTVQVRAKLRSTLPHTPAPDIDTRHTPHAHTDTRHNALRNTHTTHTECAHAHTYTRTLSRTVLAQVHKKCKHKSQLKRAARIFLKARGPKRSHKHHKNADTKMQHKRECFSCKARGLFGKNFHRFFEFGEGELLGSCQHPDRRQPNSFLL